MTKPSPKQKVRKVKKVPLIIKWMKVPKGYNPESYYIHKGELYVRFVPHKVIFPMTEDPSYLQ